jgi:hypothetical protein
MVTVEIKPKLKLNLEEILDGVAKLDLKDLENFHLKVGGLLSSRKAKSIPEREQFLIEKITGQFLPEKENKQFKALLKKQETASLSEQDNEAYQQLLQLVQNKSLQRLTWLVELSQLRGEPIATTMEKVGIKAVNPYNV